MKKTLMICALALSSLAFFAACDSGEDVVEFKDENVTMQSVTVDATFPSVTGTELKSSFTEKDFLRIRFANSEGTPVGRTQVLSGLATGKTGTFSNSKVAVPNNATNAVIYLDNKETNLVNYGSSPTAVALGSQDGTLASAQSYQVVEATVPVSSLSGNTAVSLAYKTGIVKVTVTFPEGTKVEAGKTTITIGSESQYTNVTLPFDAPGTDSEKGTLTIPATVDEAAGSATAYIAVWPVGGEYKNTSLISHIGQTTYGNNLEVTDIKAGKTTVVNQTVDSKEFNYWIPDEAYTVNDVYAKVLSASKWISVSNGVLTVEANKTGSVRKGEIVLDNGHTYKFTQIGANEFKGTWTLFAKLFDPNKSLGKGSIGAYKGVLTFGDPLKGETLTDATGATHTNNIGITGLYPGATMDACVDIDYEARTVRFGVFFDRRSAQKTTQGKYVAFLPELSSGYWSGYNFAPGAGVFSSTDYDWLWFDFPEDAETSEIDYTQAKYQYYGKGQKTAAGNHYICGISCVAATGEAASTIKGSYDVIYQANYNGNNAESMYFKKGAQ